ncbi:Gypsy retrotransposon integrase-like protein 1, partial [Mucuna pruriens]
MAVAFKKFTLLHVPLEQNERVDLLSKLATPREEGNKDRLTIKEPGVCCMEGKKTWMIPFLEYLKEDRLLSDPAKAKKLGEDSKYVIWEVHEGVCGTHIGGRALASKIASVGYYWLTLKNECMKYVKKYDRCQRFTEVLKSPLEQLHSITSPWPFYKWGVDILGPFPTAPGQVKYLNMAVDYFTKWVEAESVATILTEKIKRFY